MVHEMKYTKSIIYRDKDFCKIFLHTHTPTVERVAYLNRKSRLFELSWQDTYAMSSTTTHLKRAYL